MNSLLQQLQAHELELHHPGTRCSRERLEQLLHPAFHEVGRSGRAYTRETVIAYLAAQESHSMVVSEGFALARLAPEVVLLTYRSASHQVGTLVEHAFRASIWVKEGSAWQLRFHQGTAAAERW